MVRIIPGSFRLLLVLSLMTLILVVPAFAQIHDRALLVGSISSGGLPVEGMTIIANMVMGETYIPVSNVTTDSKGRFEVFEDLFGHPFLLEFEYGGITHFKTFVSGNGTYTIDLDLSGTLDFKVLDLDGRGVEGIEVAIVNKVGYIMGYTETDSAGSGHFEALNIGDPFSLMFDSDGVPYSQVFDFANETTASVEVQLLETTSSDGGLEMYMHHVIVEMEGEYLNVWEAITFRNLGDRIFNNSWLKIFLPSEAEEITSDVMDCCVQITAEGIVIDPMDPIFPNGTFETTIEYKIEAKLGTQILSKRMAYDTTYFYYFIENVPGVTVESPVGLSYEGERILAGTNYLIYMGPALQAGETASVQFKGLISWTDALMKNPLMWAGGLLVAPIALLVYFFVLKIDDEPKDLELMPIAPLGKITVSSGSIEEESLLAGKGSRVDFKVELNELRPVLYKVEEEYMNGGTSEKTHSPLISRCGENLKEIEAELQSPREDDEMDDLAAEESAIGAVLGTITSNHNMGMLSEREFYLLKERYEARLAEVKSKLEKNG